MKILSLLGLTTFATLLLSNCSNEDEIVDKTIAQGDAVVSATIDGGNSRVNIAESTGLFSWSKGDNIGVYTTENKFQTFTLRGNGGSAQGEFDGSLGSGQSTLCAVYPADGGHSVNNKTLTFHMADEYAWSEGNTNIPMLATIKSVGSTAYYFTHLGGAFRFIVTNWPKDAVKLVFKTSNNITGNFNIDLSGSAPYSIASTNATDGSNSMTLTFPNDKTSLQSEEDVKKVFYIPVPTGTYKGYEFEIQDDGGEILKKYVSVNTNTVNRKTFLDMPKITFTTVDGSISADASSPDELNNLLNPKTESGVEAPTNIALTGAATKSIQTIEIPETYTASSSSGSSPKPLALVFNEVPTASSGAIEIKDKNTTATPAASVSSIEIAIPEVTQSSGGGQITAPSLDIALPKNTVTLSANGATATYNEVSATTATSTLVVNKGVTVKKLTINGGNVEILGTVNELIIANSNTTTTSVKVTGEGVCKSYVNSSTGATVKYENLWDGTSKVAPIENGKIYSAAELAYFQSANANIQGTASSLPVTMDADYTLQNDIDLGGHSWLGIVLGGGRTFDGNGKTISNLSMTKPILYENGEPVVHSACIGLFAAAYSDSEIKDINLDGVKVGTEAKNVGCKWVGSLVGYSQAKAYTSCKAENVELYTNFGFESSYRVGGLIGFIASNDPTLTNCEVSEATIIASFSYGGLIGSTMSASTTFKGCKTSNIKLRLGNCSNDYLGYVSKFIGDVDMDGGTRTVTIDNASLSEALTSDEKDALHFYQITKGGQTYADGNQYVGIIKKTTLTLSVNESTLTNGIGYNKYETPSYTPGGMPQYEDKPTGWD